MEIPGYEIQRAIGRGGMSHVFLAKQRNFDRPVALKIMSPQFANDAQFKKRFVQEARIVAQLNHPHIVQVHDVGIHEDYLFLVMEYLQGGDLNTRLEKGLHMQAVLTIVSEIASALDYAHDKGYVHRDIKPENILFREQGSAVLSDFGIARTIDATRPITRHGFVVGTPQYMSPEQAAGQKLDGRSDLYSLGIVFYRMLTGDVPYDDTSAVSVGNQHLQAPIPMLPVHLAAFQDVLNRLLAKDPANRPQSGQEVVRALEQVRAEGVVPNAVVKTDLITTAEIEAVAIPLIAPREQMRADRGDQTPRGRRRTAAIILAVLLFSIVGVMTYFVTTEPETVTALLARTGLTEDPALHEAWQAAEALREDPNQSLSTIVAAYRRVLDIEPTHEGARVGVDAVATQWKVDIDVALESDDLALADAKLTESLNLFPRDEELTVLFDRLADRRRADLLLASTQTLLESQSLSHVPSATAAIQSYQEVLRLHPGDEQALAQLDRLAVHYGKLASEAASAGNVSVAMNNLGRATTANPDFSGLASVREQISQAASLQAEIDGMLQQASALRAEAALIDPPEANAAEIYHRVLATDPDNVIANQGLSEVAARVLTQFNAYLLSGEFERVQQLVDRSVAVGLGDTPITEMKNRYEAELARLDTVASLLIEASELIQNGFLTDPVDKNAVARLREVIRLDPENSEAQILLENVAKRLASVAQEAFDVGLTVEARHYLDLALTVNPDVDRWRSLRDLWGEGR